jgi:hypothetical protein
MIAKSFKPPHELVDEEGWQDAPMKRLFSACAPPGRRDRVQRRHCLCHERVRESGQLLSNFGVHLRDRGFDLLIPAA